MVREICEALEIIDGARSTRPYPGRSPLGRFVHSLISSPLWPDAVAGEVTFVGNLPPADVIIRRVL